jgi:hypothetical protein
MQSHVMLIVVMLSVVILSVAFQSLVMLRVILLSVAILSAVMMSVILLSIVYSTLLKPQGLTRWTKAEKVLKYCPQFNVSGHLIHQSAVSFSFSVDCPTF